MMFSSLSNGLSHCIYTLMGKRRLALVLRPDLFAFVYLHGQVVLQPIKGGGADYCVGQLGVPSVRVFLLQR